MLDVGDIVSFEIDESRYTGRIIASNRKTSDPLVRYFCPAQFKYFTVNIPWRRMGHASFQDKREYMEAARVYNATKERQRVLA